MDLLLTKISVNPIPGLVKTIVDPIPTTDKVETPTESTGLK